MGLQVLGTFSVGQRSFMVGGVRVEPRSELDGLRMIELSTQTRVIAISRDGRELKLHPRRDTRMVAGDTAYLVGPYRELLDTLRKGQRVQTDERSREEQKTTDERSREEQKTTDERSREEQKTTDERSREARQEDISAAKTG
jgi:NhaP-type Na+/H+ and K+/H+ antiporter